MTRKLFGTDGIRGPVNREPITAETVLAVGSALAALLKREGAAHPRVLIARDTRSSGMMIQSALHAGLLSNGVDVVNVDILPSPAAAHLTRTLECDAGIMISASHNPPEDNGLKIFARDGFKIPDEWETFIEVYAGNGTRKTSKTHFAEPGRISRPTHCAMDYTDFVTRSVFPAGDLCGVRIAMDCAHGAAYRTAPALFTALGADVHLVGTEPDGRNINTECGVEDIGSLRSLAKRIGAHVGIAFDGDADRVAFLDERGREVHSDKILGLIALDMLRRGSLKQNTLVATVAGNYGLEAAIAEAGGKVVRTPVGDRHVMEAMRDHGYNFGGEPSGHIVFFDHIPSGDGIIAALAALKIIRETGRTLSELASEIALMPQQLANIPVRVRRDLDDIPELVAAIRDAELRLKPSQGRVLVRYSGTQSVCRILVEGCNESELRKAIAEISAVVRMRVQ